MFSAIILDLPDNLIKASLPSPLSVYCTYRPLESAAQRRLSDELGLKGIELTLALPQFRYRAEYLGVVENEICPVLIGLCEKPLHPNPQEVAATGWVNWAAFITNDPQFDHYSPWSKWEAEQLARSPLLTEMTGRNHFCSPCNAAFAKRRSG